ncbi:protein FAM161B isoform X2 [Amia ocellicauda]|uniref:protein FAM161B isoform X2 n=1 Tax=Amia ocellicauda TaxID=2972642 RepID=UPI0034639034
MPASHTMSFFNEAENMASSSDGQVPAAVRSEEGASTQCTGSRQRQGFPPRDDSVSDGEVAHSRLNRRDTDQLLAFLEQDGGPAGSELHFYHRLQTLKEAHTHKLLQTGRLYQEQLEQRMLQDSLLSASDNRKTKQEDNIEEIFSTNGRQNVQTASSKACASRYESLRRSCSLSDLNSQEEGVSPQLKGSERPVGISAAWAPSRTVPKPFGMTLKEGQRRSQLFRSRVSQDLEKKLSEKSEAEEAECQKQFRAAPVPAHVFLPLYQDITEAGERLRRTSLQQRKDFLLSMQKPFSFVERVEKKKEELKQQLKSSNPVLLEEKSKPAEKKKIPKAVQDPGVSEHLKEDELYRKIRIQMRAADLLKTSSAPIALKPQRKDPESSSGQRMRREALGFLDQKPTFRPHTNTQVPDFERLYQAFQREALKRAERKDVTRCQPFQLRTSHLPPRQSRKTPPTPQEQRSVSRTHLKRSQSFSGILSLSTNTLPVYTTDAERQRRAAIRNSLEEKDNKERESAGWMKQHRLQSEAMKKNVNTRARAMDPHKSLKEVYQEKLKQHRSESGSLPENQAM